VSHDHVSSSCLLLSWQFCRAAWTILKMSLACRCSSSQLVCSKGGRPARLVPCKLYKRCWQSPEATTARVIVCLWSAPSRRGLVTPFDSPSSKQQRVIRSQSGKRFTRVAVTMHDIAGCLLTACTPSSRQRCSREERNRPAAVIHHSRPKLIPKCSLLQGRGELHASKHHHSPCSPFLQAISNQVTRLPTDP
jgi:hypothetical protein